LKLVACRKGAGAEAPKLGHCDAGLKARSFTASPREVWSGVSPASLREVWSGVSPASCARFGWSLPGVGARGWDDETKHFPQRLKPTSGRRRCGPAEARFFQSNFRAAVES